MNIDWASSIEEPWSDSELEHTSLSHGLLHNDVDDLTHGLGVLLGVDGVLSLMIDGELALPTHVSDIKEIGLIQLLSGPNVVARVEELTDQCFDLSSFSVNDLGELKWSWCWSITFSLFDESDGVLVNLRSIFADGHLKLVSLEIHLLRFGILWITHSNQRLGWLVAKAVASTTATSVTRLWSSVFVVASSGVVVASTSVATFVVATFSSIAIATLPVSIAIAVAAAASSASTSASAAESSTTASAAVVVASLSSVLVVSGVLPSGI